MVVDGHPAMQLGLVRLSSGAENMTVVSEYPEAAMIIAS